MGLTGNMRSPKRKGPLGTGEGRGISYGSDVYVTTSPRAQSSHSPGPPMGTRTSAVAEARREDGHREDSTRQYYDLRATSMMRQLFALIDMTLTSARHRPHIRSKS